MPKAATSDSPFPESEKLHSAGAERDAITGFVYWLADVKGAHIATFQGENLQPLMETTEDLIYEHLGIDKEKLEEERQRILEAYKEYNADQEAKKSNTQTRAGRTV